MANYHFHFQQHEEGHRENVRPPTTLSAPDSPPLDKDIRGGEWVQDNPLYYSGLGGVGGGSSGVGKPPPHIIAGVCPGP